MVKNIAVITDIHGNYSALKAVLSDIEREGKVKSRTYLLLRGFDRYWT
ncbi:hypothetical protein ACFVP8_08895 [Viridibacillus arvi]